MSSNPKFWVALRAGEMELACHWAMMMGALGYLLGAEEVVAGRQDKQKDDDIIIPKKVVIKYIADYKRQLAKQMNARMTGEPK